LRNKEQETHLTLHEHDDDDNDDDDDENTAQPQTTQFYAVFNILHIF
jgi:hypothetical protein